MIIGKALLAEVRKRAEESPRLRMNFNFHEGPEAGAQRLINSLLPGTEIPVHRHPHTSETYILLDGHLRVDFYDEEGRIAESFDLCAGSPAFGVHIPKGQWHGMEVIEPSSIFEVKDGPYTPITPDNILSK